MIIMMPNIAKRLVNSMVLTCWLLALSCVANSNPLFPQPAALKPDIDFWTRVYTEISTRQGFIHDNAKLGVVYETVNIDGLGPKQRKKRIESVKKRYLKILKKLASGARSNLSAQEKRVLNLWPKGVSNGELKRAQSRIRFQLGQSDKFKEGLVRSGRWRPFILKTLKDMGLPEEIAALPHVESSFNPKAYSHVGAAGMWQFMRSTGRRFMKVNHVVDERLDPFVSSVAAARLLQQNYKTTGTWPLAMTAYNHGAAGMRRAARQVGTTDITTVLRKYRSRTFKFASRNFYVAFMAAVNIRKNPKKYFGDIRYDKPEQNHRIKLASYMSAKDVAKHMGISVSKLKTLNPALRPNVWSGNKYVPKGYSVRTPTYQSLQGFKQALASLPKSQKPSRQKRDLTYRVRRGDNLSAISKRFNVSVRDLMAFNNIRKRNHIRVGQVLRLPSKAGVKKPPREINYGQYKVRRGDTLSQVAENFGMSVKRLMALNGLTNKNQLVAGQTLRVKGKPVKTTSENPRNYTVKRGDTLSEIATNFNITQKTLMALNGLTNRNNIVPGQILRLTGESVTEAEEKKDQPEVVKDVAVYQVKKGDSLISIANAYGISLNELLAMNDVRKRNVLRIGYELKVPKHDEVESKLKTAQEYKVRKGDTLSEIAKNFGLKESELLAINGLTNRNKLVPGQVLRLTSTPDSHTPAIEFATYQVKKGDSLISIANQHHVSLKELLAMNDVRKKNVLRIGQELRVPKPEDETGKDIVVASADLDKVAVDAKTAETKTDSKGQEAKEDDTKTASTADSKSDNTNDSEDTVSSDPEAEELTPEELAALESAPALDEVEAIAAEEKEVAETEDKDSTSDEASPANPQPVLAADPSDYAVGDDSRIEVLAGETLGHYADWLQIKTGDLRRLNKMSFKKPVVIGQKLKLKFSTIDKAKFELTRVAYHKSLQDTYFDQYQITDTKEHTVKKGDSIWKLTQQIYNVPLWLLMQYNPDLVLHQLKPGDKLVFPVTQEKTQES